MAITTTFTLTFLGNMTAGDYEENVAITPVSGGGFLTAGDNPTQILGLTINDIDLRPYGDDGSAGAFSQGSSGGIDPSLAQLSSVLLLPTPNNVVLAYETSGEIHYSFLDPDGDQEIAPVAIGDTNTSQADVAILQARFGIGGGGFSGGFVIAYQDAFTAGSETEHDIDIRFYNNGGVQQSVRIVDSTVNDDQGASVTQLDNGNVAVAWTRFHDDGTTDVMYAVYSRDNGTVVRAPTTVANLATTNRDVSIVATDSGFALLYEQASGSGLGATRGIRMSSFSETGASLGSRTLVSSGGLGGTTFNDIDATRMSNGLIAFSYTRGGGFIFSDDDVVVQLTSQAPGDSTVSAAVEITGGAAGNDDALDSAIAAAGDRLGVIYDNDTTGGSNGEILQLLRIHTGDGADDTFIGTVGRDSYIGGEGRDTLDYSAQTAALTVNLATGAASGGAATGDSLSGIENLLGGSGNDSLSGNAQTNRLEGGAGNDTLAGGGGGDLLEGDAGNDRLLGAGGSDTMSGDGGHDDMNGGAGQDDMFGGAGFDVMAGGAGRDDLFGGAGRDTLTGGGGDDALRGGGGADALSGSGGRDTLTAGAGHDRLFGGGGADALSGGAGRDTLDGGPGNDILTGGGGNDVFVFGPGGGRDIVTDFQNNRDHIDLTGGLTFADVNVIALGGGGVRLTFDGEPGLTLTLLTANPGQIDAGDFI